MTPALKASARHWLAGIAIAFTGVALSRLVASGLDDPRARAAVALCGQFIALGGLLVIILGIRRRLRNHASDAGSSTT